MTKEEKKDEMKNRISMALKDPILQQGFEIICKNVADLERENRTLKSLLYCTKRSCNNCGKVNCENFQRQRIDCCGLWVSYKDYITELEKKIADIKANCDLAIEGRDVKIKELEQENTELKEKNKSYEGIIDNSSTTLMRERLESYKQLTKATELINLFIQWNYGCCDIPDYKDIVKQAEQFLKEIEK